MSVLSNFYQWISLGFAARYSLFSSRPLWWPHPKSVVFFLKYVGSSSPPSFIHIALFSRRSTFDGYLDSVVCCLIRCWASSYRYVDQDHSLNFVSKYQDSAHQSSQIRLLELGVYQTYATTFLRSNWWYRESTFPLCLQGLSSAISLKLPCFRTSFLALQPPWFQPITTLKNGNFKPIDFKFAMSFKAKVSIWQVSSLVQQMKHLFMTCPKRSVHKF